jgi:hypothetical protein
MARSYSIFIVLHDTTHLIEGAFTVKHEMVSWLRDRPGLDGGISIYRVKDGIHQDNNPTRVGGYSDFVEK